MAKDLARSAAFGARQTRPRTVYECGPFRTTRPIWSSVRSGCGGSGVPGFFVEQQTLQFRPRSLPGRATAFARLGAYSCWTSARSRRLTTGAGERGARSCWDPKRKKEILGKATSPQGLPQIVSGHSGGEGGPTGLRQRGRSRLWSTSARLRPRQTADGMAQALCNEIGGGLHTAEENCFGNARCWRGAQSI